MTDVINFTKKAFTWSVVVMTIAWSVGLSALAAPIAANAAECPALEAGDLFKVTGNSAVYLVNADMERMYFPHSSVYNTWYADFSGVVEIDPTCTSAYPNSTNPSGVNFRPGSRLVKVVISPDVYAVGPDNMRHKIGSEEEAAALYGANWASLVRDVHDFHWPNYTTGAEVDGIHDGQLVSTGASSDVYYAWGGKLHMVDGSLPAFVAGDVRTVSQDLVDDVEMSGDTVTAASVTADPAQGAGGDSPDGETPVVVDGELTVSLSANTPAAAVVPYKASQVPYLTFKVKAGDEAVTIQSIEFKRTGLGASSNFDKVWLAVDGVPVSNDQSVNSDNLTTLSPNYALSAGGSVEFTLVANLVSTGASVSTQDSFSIVSASAVDTDGNTDVMGSFPITGSAMSYTSYDVGTATINERGSAEEVEVGDEQVVVGEFEVDFTSGNESDARINFLRLKQDGTFDTENLENLSLYEDGVELDGVTVSVSGDYATFKFNSAAGATNDGDTRRFEIRADLTDGDDADVIQWKLDDNRDFSVTEVDSGFGSTITNNLNQGTGTDGMYDYTVDAGQFNINLAASNPKNESYAPGTDDVVALVAKIDAGQKINVDGLKVYLHSSSDISNGTDSAADDDDIDADIERAELFVNSKRITSLTAVTPGGAANANDAVEADEFYYDFDSSFTLADDDVITLVLDIDEDADASNVYKFTFDTGDFTDVEYALNGDSVPSGNKAGSATGNNVTITDASLTVTRNDGHTTNEPFIMGSDDNMIFGFLMDNSDTGAIDIRTLNFDFSNVQTASSSYFQNLYLTFDGVQVGDSKDLTTSGVNFSGLSYDLGGNEQVQVRLYSDVETGLATSDDVTTVVTLDQSDSLIVDDNGDTVTSGWSDTTSATLLFKVNPTLNIAIDGDTADSAVVVASGSDTAVTLGTWRLDADDGTVNITDLYFANNTSTGSHTAETGADFLVEEFQLVVDGVVLDSSAPASGKVHFELSGDDELEIPATGVTRVDVRAVLNDIDAQADTGKQLALALYALEAEGPSSAMASSSFGVGSGVSVLASDSTAQLDEAPTANTHLLTRTAPTVVAGGNDFTSSNNYQGTLSNSDVKVFEFTVTADSAFDVSWRQIELDISGSCTTYDDIEQCVGATSSMRIEDGSGDTLTATFATGTDEIVIRLASTDTVSAGASEVYSVYATLDGFTGDNDSLGIKIEEDATSFNEPDDYLTVDGNGSFIWSDNSGTYESTTAASWFTGFNVNGINPTKTVTLKQ